ncbi:MAG: Ig-like domain-containing protein, partial [Deltaproteobacteria bacterium]|nr:Ig-like domain-containing protein [Deltaproteobacteria bacterium]
MNRVVDGGVTSACLGPEPAPPLQSCMADAEVVTLTPGGTRDLSFFGILHDSRLVPALPFVLASSAPAIATVYQDGRVSALLQGEATITATAGGASCEVPVHVLQAAAGNAVHVVVEDEDTGRPLSGAPVQLRARAGAVRVATTDSTGFTRFEGIADIADVVDVTAAPATHNWLTYAKPRVRDLLLRVPALVTEPRHGSATRPEIVGSGDIHEALHVMSATGDLDRISLATFPGPPVETMMNIAGIIDHQMVPLPAGMTMRLQSDDVKGVAAAQVDDACGGAERCPRAAVTFGVRSSINRASALLTQRNTDPGGFLWDRVPLFRGGVHAVELRMFNRIGMDGGMPSATSVTHVVTPARQAALWRIPPLPSLDGEFPPRLMQALVIVGVRVPRLGFVPLGFDAVADACVDSGAWQCEVSAEQDGVVSCAAPEHQSLRCNGLHPGQIGVSHAYPHDGLETFPLMAMVLASWPGDEDQPQRPTSLLFSHEPSWSGTTPGQFAAWDFLGIPDGRWNPSQRSYTVTRVPDGTHFVRLRAEDGTRSWTVYAPVPAVPAVLEWPPAPPGAAAFAPGDATLSSWQLASGSLAEMSSIRGGGLRDL